MLPYDFDRLRHDSNQESLCHAVFDDAHSKWTDEGRAAINESQLVVMCVETFFGEMRNGGLEQYLWNESGRNASVGPTALRKVGLVDYATLLEEALGRCTNKPERNDLGELEDFFETPDYDEESILEDLNQRFFKLWFADRDLFRKKLFCFIVDHEADFVSLS